MRKKSLTIKFTKLTNIFYYTLQNALQNVSPLKFYNFKTEYVTEYTSKVSVHFCDNIFLTIIFPSNGC